MVAVRTDILKKKVQEQAALQSDFNQAKHMIERFHARLKKEASVYNF